jgi:hypothetical protein
MPRHVIIGFGTGLMAGTLLALLFYPQIATAQGANNGNVGNFQIQFSTGVPLPGTSTIWRLNTATGALDYCTFTNVIVSGANHITCQGNPK